MGEGWETRRRRGSGNDWLVVRLAAPGVIRLAEIDTLHYKGNAPAAAMLRGIDTRPAPPAGAPRTGAALTGAELTRAPLTEAALARAALAGAPLTEAEQAATLADEAAWFPLLPRTRLQPDTQHRFPLPSPAATADAPNSAAWTDVAGQPATHVRLDIYPDGGVARLRLYGSVTPDALADLHQRWQQTT
jgi:allantoicase